MSAPGSPPPGRPVTGPPTWPPLWPPAHPLPAPDASQVQQGPSGPWQEPPPWPGPVPSWGSPPAPARGPAYAPETSAPQPDVPAEPVTAEPDADREGAVSRRSRRAAHQDAGWLRRNVRGLAALPLALALAVGWDVHVLLDAREAGRPSVAATVPAGQWATSGEVRYRLASIARESDLTDRYGQPVALPAGSALWRAQVDVLLPAGVKAPGCLTRLIDREGRRFDDSPRGTSVLKGIRCPLDADPVADGTTGSSSSPAASLRERTVQASLLYLMPDGAQPAQLWIASIDQVPHYLALTVPASAS